jgi:hypothetical protein
MRQSHYSTITCILLLPTVHHCRTPYRTMSISGKTITDPELPTCIRCRSSPARRCTGCLGAPSYDEETLMPSFYCSVDCQKAGLALPQNGMPETPSAEIVKQGSIIAPGHHLQNQKAHNDTSNHVSTCGKHDDSFEWNSARSIIYSADEALSGSLVRGPSHT